MMVYYYFVLKTFFFINIKTVNSLEQTLSTDELLKSQINESITNSDNLTTNNLNKEETILGQQLDLRQRSRWRRILRTALPLQVCLILVIFFCYIKLKFNFFY